MVSFKALLLNRTEHGVTALVDELPQDALPEGDVTVRVAYSSLNYKDGLAVTGQGKVVSRYPMVPGIDLAGTVLESRSPDYRPGQEVMLTGWGVGELHWGGYAQLARVRSEWLLPLPDGMTLKQAMALGTAGLTAMLCVMALEGHGQIGPNRQVVVTGAGGGVGSIAVALLASLGHSVVASTGREEIHDYLRSLGASEILDRNLLAVLSDRPLESERWGGAVDTVGGATLASLLRTMAYRTSVAACGLAGGTTLSTTVFPFILRGVNLLGIDSVHCPKEARCEAWRRLAREIPQSVLDRIVQVIPLEQVPAAGRAILAGRIKGRVVVNVNG